MTKVTPSLYFDNAEQFIKLHPDHAPLAILMSAVRNNGCPDELIDSVINGAIAQEVNRMVTPQEMTLTVSKDDKNYPSIEPFNPSYEELIDYVTTRFTDLGNERAKGIVDVLIHKGALTVFNDGMVYRTMLLVPRIPLTI